MTKLVSVRVVLAVDDDVELKDVKPRLQARITTGGTENLAAEDGESAPPKRIHWGTADVLQGPERAPGRARTSRGSSKEAAT